MALLPANSQVYLQERSMALMWAILLVREHLTALELLADTVWLVFALAVQWLAAAEEPTARELALLLVLMWVLGYSQVPHKRPDCLSQRLIFVLVA
jgi:hypothetical protein